MIKRKLFIIISASILLFSALNFFSGKSQAIGVVKAFGPLNVIFSSTPLFEANNVYPGLTIEKTFSVDNTDNKPHDVLIKAGNVKNSLLSAVIYIVIKQGDKILYGSDGPSGRKSLADFYKEAFIKLNTLAVGENAAYLITLKMNTDSSDEYQQLVTSFDLLVGVDEKSLVNIPPILPHPTFRPLPTIARLPKLPPIHFPFFR